MTNYEKLISSVLLSTVLTGKAFGWGCNCDDNDDNDENETVDLVDKKNLKFNTGNNKCNINTDQNEIIDCISNGDFDVFIYFYTYYKNATNEKDLKQRGIMNKSIFMGILNKIMAQCISLLKQPLVDIGEAQDEFEQCSFVEQIQLIGLMIDVSKCFANKNVSLDTFSKNLLYSFRKKQFNESIKNYDISDLKIKDNSTEVKKTYLKVRNPIFEALYKYVYNYLEIGLEKFGITFYNKQSEIVKIKDKINDFYAKINQSDKNDYLSKFIDEKNICRNTFEDIDYILDQTTYLPKFNDVFEKNDSKKIIIKRGQTSALDKYYTFYNTIKQKYTKLENDKSKEHILNFFSCKTERRNDNAHQRMNVTKTVLELKNNRNNIDQNTIFKFTDGLKVDNIDFETEDI